jgi:hypothetical protein
MNKMEKPTFLQAIKRVEAEVDKRFEQRSENERGLYATQEEVDALRSLAATLVMVFGPFPMIGFE